MTQVARYDAAVIGGGHNGLVCAAYLARAGMRTVVLERRERVGGALGTHQLAPGVRVPDLAHGVGRLRASVVRDLGLQGDGLKFVQPDARMTGLAADAPPITLWGSVPRIAVELASLSPRDAQRYERFDAEVRGLASLLGRMHAMTPPDPSAPRLVDAVGAARLGLGYRRLGAAHARAFLRVLPMPIGDYLEDWFEGERLRSLLAWRGIRYSGLGPHDAGTAQVFLADVAGTAWGAAGDAVFVVGGPGALADALATAARRLGVEIRTDADVREITTAGDRAAGVTLGDGTHVDADTIVSAVDPKRTLLNLMDPAIVGPQLGWRAGNLRLGGSVSKVDLVLARLPSFGGLGEHEEESGRAPFARLRGRLVMAGSIRELDRMADALKGRRLAERLILEATIPSLVDPSLVDNGVEARHVMSVLVQGTPFHRRDGISWDQERGALGDRVVAQLDEVAPGIGELVIARRVLTPLELEREYGMTEGHPLHGEPALDQWFAWRPMLGLAQYRLPLEGLYLCASGAHPGGGVTGLPGRNAAREILTDRKRSRADA